MSRLRTEEIRRLFLDYFVQRAHQEISSSSLVPAHDPTLLFTNAGMVQFKDVFTGKETRAYSRATSVQKCVRAGGKHNDLENVGVTPRHHTFFEMLGNFSFGDYFKAEAVEFAWTLITEKLGLDPDRLCVTVFKGEDDIPGDEEAFELWRSIGVPAERIFRLGKSENYWQMGDTGPQGPCSEIHYYMGGKAEEALDEVRVAESDGWMEIWNLVFMQFAKEASDGPLVPLPKPSIDTGAGLERLAVVLQGKQSNYEIDLFEDLLNRIAEAAGKGYGRDPEDDVSMRVIADHARATAFLVADGVQPAKDGRGYVLRRIMRRAIRHGDRLGFSDLFFYRACADVVEAMQGAYPELKRAATLIEKVAESEENSFRTTLSRGLKYLEQKFEAKPQSLEPAFVAELYDTYGFPIDLTRVIAEERGVEVNEEASLTELKRRQQSDTPGRLSSGGEVNKTWFELRDEFGSTEFVGYQTPSTSGTVQAIVVEDRRTHSLDAGQEGWVLVDRTSMYGESGGQVGDQGELRWTGGRAHVLDVHKPLPQLHAHRVKVDEGQLSPGLTVVTNVDTSRLVATRRNHSATHLLHLALREILGQHVQQKGSLVSPERLRFDFAHFESLTREQEEQIELRVNQLILSNRPTEANAKTIDEAREEGALMLFGEKYGDEVRVVRIGGDSLELCGGLHVERSGDIGLFKLLSDSGVAAGVRRVEAITGEVALTWLQQRERTLLQSSALMKSSPEQLVHRIDKMARRTKQLEKELEEANARAAMGGEASSDPVEETGGIRFLIKEAHGTPKKALRPLADKLRDKLGSGVVLLAASDGDKAAILVAATKDLSGQVHAGQIVKAVTEAMGGSGGGRPDFAQGGGPLAKLAEGLAAGRAAIVGKT